MPVSVHRMNNPREECNKCAKHRPNAEERNARPIRVMIPSPPLRPLLSINSLVLPPHDPPPPLPYRPQPSSSPSCTSAAAVRSSNLLYQQHGSPPFFSLFSPAISPKSHFSSSLRPQRQKEQANSPCSATSTPARSAAPRPRSSTSPARCRS